jgi:hypothetical protein
VGGTSTYGQGGSFSEGFLAAAFTKGAGELSKAGGFGFIDNPEGLKRAYNAVLAAVIGGTAASLGGGKFANGAVTGAFSRMFADASRESIYDRGAGAGVDEQVTQDGLNDIVEQVYGDYPELEGYGMAFDAVDKITDQWGRPAAGEWYEQDRIRIATSGFSKASIRATVLHELLHVDAANYGLALGQRFLYGPTTLWRYNHAEIRVFQANYRSYLDGTPYLDPNGQLTTGLRSLDTLSWRR